MKRRINNFNPILAYSYEHAPTVGRYFNSARMHPDGVVRATKLRAISGPPGSSKSVACVMEHLHFLAQRQTADNNGMRRTKVAIIRATYRDLQRTTYKTAMEWIMPGSGDIPSSSPMRGQLRYPHPTGDGTTVEVDVEFLAIQTLDDLKAMDSLEVSSVYINEGNEQLRQVYTAALERIGRFPPPKDGVPCLEPCVSIDFNLPGKEHWLHDVFVKGEGIEFNEYFGPDDIAYFEQPPAVFCPNYQEVLEDASIPPIFEFNPAAENLANLPEGYYGTQLANNNWPRKQSRLMMKWVTPNTGKRIHEDFKPQYHKAKVHLKPERGVKVLVGFDTSGQNKGLCYCQYIEGQLRVIAENFYGGGTIGAIEKVLQVDLATLFPDSEALIICDPANSKDDALGVTPTALLKARGYDAVRAPGNNKLEYRINAMSTLFEKQQGILISLACTMILEGLEINYVFKKDHAATKALGIEIYKDEKEDNAWGHYVDSLQNVALYVVRNGTQLDNENMIVGRKLVKKRIV